MFNITRIEYSVSKFQYRAPGDERQATFFEQFAQKMPLHLSRILYKSNLFLQNEPNLKQLYEFITAYTTSTYKIYVFTNTPKNEPKRTQNEPNFSLKLASFSRIKPNFKPNYVKIGNLGDKKLTRNADFFDEPECEFRAVREETFERLDLVNIGPAVNISFQAWTAGIIIESAVYIIKRVFATAGGAVSVNRTEIIFKEAASAIF